MESILVVAEKNAGKDRTSSKLYVPLDFTTIGEIEQDRKGYGGLASKRMKRALKAFQKSHELIEHASSNLDRGILYVNFTIEQRKITSNQHRYSCFALLLRESGDVSQEKNAIMYHDLATKYAPQWNRMWLEQGVTFQMLGRFENASESYLRATECSNSDYTAWVRYAHVHKFRSDVKQDMNTIEEMLRMLPPDDER